jgi:hypothetical protein
MVTAVASAARRPSRLAGLSIVASVEKMPWPLVWVAKPVWSRAVLLHGASRRQHRRTLPRRPPAETRQ